MKTSVFCNYCSINIFRYKTKTGKYFCNIEHKALWQKKQREDNGWNYEWLYDQYVVQKKDCYQIGIEIGRDSKRVWEWIKDYGIETRPRGTATHLKEGVKFGVGNIGRIASDETRQKLRDARKKDGRIPAYINGVHWLKFYNRKPGSWKGGITPERQSFYSSLEWVEAVKKVWKRDNATCQNCNQSLNSKEKRGRSAIHHIVSFKNKELRSNVDNLILLCRDCHLWVHSRKNVDKKFIID